MTIIENLTATRKQNFSTQITEGKIDFILTYFPAIQKWFIDVSFKDSVIVKGYRLCKSFNLLFQWKKIIPFGIVVYSDEETEPFLIDDFSSGRFFFGILNQTEIEEIDVILSEGRDEIS